MSWWSNQTDNTQGGILGAIGGGLSGLFGYKGTKDTNIASAQQAQNQMDFQERMSNTAIQRRMADLKKAALIQSSLENLMLHPQLDNKHQFKIKHK